VVDTGTDEVVVVLHLTLEDVEINKLVDFDAVVNANLVSYFDNEVSLFCQLMHFVCMPDGVLYPNVVHEPFP
jgi:hypothetical protein